jgi:hypothetical protein
MEIKPIKTDSDYREVLKEIEIVMMASPDTSEGERLDVQLDWLRPTRTNTIRLTYACRNSSEKEN